MNYPVRTLINPKLQIWSESSIPSFRRLSLDTLASSVASSTSSLRKMCLDTSSGSPVVETFGDKVGYIEGLKIKIESQSADALSVRRACRYDCYCACHAQDKAGAGKGFPGFNPLKYNCSEPSCQRAMPSEEKIVVPSSFFRKAFSHVIVSKSNKVLYDLNAYRMVSEWSDAMRYVKHRNLKS